jgi:hypothetical protein
MDMIAFYLISSPIFYVVIIILLLIHMILSEKHNRRSEKLEQQILEQLNDKQVMPRYTWNSTPTRQTPVPINNEIV